MPWWYRASGTFRTQIWALWRPRKPKPDFQGVEIWKISKTHFLTSNGSKMDPKSATEAPNTNSERYWPVFFMVRKGQPLQIAIWRLQSSGKGSDWKLHLPTSKFSISKTVFLKCLKLCTSLIHTRDNPQILIWEWPSPFLSHFELYLLKFSFSWFSDLCFSSFAQF